MNKKSKLIDADNVHLWFDEDRGKYLLIHNDTGETKEVMKNGDLIRRCDPAITGNANFQQRLDYSKTHKEYVPHIPESVELNSNRLYYNPIVSKFDGYFMMRSPLGTPWYNDMNELKSDKKRIDKWRKFSKDHLNAKSHKNISLYEDHHGDVKHLTASLFTLNQISKPDPGEKLKFNEQIERQRKLAKKLKVLKSPNLTLYKSVQSKLEDDHKTKVKEEKEHKEQLERSRPVNITTMRYTNKINDVSNKQINFSAMDQFTQQTLASFTQLKTQESVDQSLLNSKIQGYDTRTFDKKIRLRQNSFDNTKSNIKPASFYEAKAKLESEELKGFEIIVPPEKKTVLTKLRFNHPIPNEGDLYKNDRKLMMRFHPELYEVKVNKSIAMKAPLEVKKKKEILEQIKAKAVEDD